KGGAVVDRIEPGEIDHGQHDSVLDVFLAPGGCTLVRADLFAELGGFDPAIVAMGEDLDLCWRAQILGARVVVAPGARVRHLELLASGRRPLPEHVLRGMPGAEGAGPGTPPPAVTAVPGGEGEEGGAGTGPEGASPGAEGSDGPAPGPVSRVSLQALQRRHELLSALKAYGPWHRVRVLPQVAVLALAEWTVAALAGHRARAGAIAHAWRWNLGRRRVARAARSELQAHRRLGDAEVRRLQLHGSARLNAYLRRAVTHGLEAANVGGGHRGEADLEGSGHDDRGGADAAGVGEGGDGDGDEGPSTSTRWLVLSAAALVVVFGSRELIGPGFPSVGQLLPLPGWATLVHRFLSGWQPTGVGSTDPTSPAAGVLGVAGFVLFGSVGLLQKVLVLGCIPAGALGMSRLVRPLGTTWARITAVVVYLAVPVPYDAIATARFDALVAYAVCPWMLHLLARLSGVEPHATAVGTRHESLRRAWRHPLVRGTVALGLLDAGATALAPTTAFLVLVLTLGLALGTVVVAGRRGLGGARRALVGGVGATVVAVVLLAPWSIAVLGGPQRWATLAGLPVTAASAPGWGQLLRLAVGPIGNDALGWAFLAAAALPLVIGARLRLAWAARAWSVAVVAWLLAWLSGRGWLGSLALSPQVLLVPAAVGLALGVGLGVAAFQRDLPGYRFGWRQGAAVVAAAAAVVGMLPVLATSVNGHWDLVSTGYGEATSWMGSSRAPGDFRVLWLGDPRLLPGGGWALSPGLAYAVSENGLPDATALWSGSDPGPAAAVARDVELARSGSTVRLGRLLAPYAVRYVVVVEALAPAIPGLQTPLSLA
ncbi:MAG TPA: glycosyltransferase, partial [Acidimicrobiales bacterium]|nr:glycosyltransferase [Acidimicrobiales bacterium]